MGKREGQVFPDPWKPWQREEEGKQVGQEPQEAEQAGSVPNSLRLPTAIRTIWAKSIPAAVWYPLTHQFFNSSRPGKSQKRPVRISNQGFRELSLPSLGKTNMLQGLNFPYMLCNNYLNVCPSPSTHGVNQGRSPFVRANATERQHVGCHSACLPPREPMQQAQLSREIGAALDLPN